MSPTSVHIFYVRITIDPFEISTTSSNSSSFISTQYLLLSLVATLTAIGQLGFLIQRLLWWCKLICYKQMYGHIKSYFRESIQWSICMSHKQFPFFHHWHYISNIHQQMKEKKCWSLCPSCWNMASMVTMFVNDFHNSFVRTSYENTCLSMIYGNWAN